MRRHQNTLYVTTDGAYLAKEGETVCVRIDAEVKLKIPLLNLEGVVCFGNVGCSPALMGACAENGISISFLDMRGRFLASVLGFSPGNVLLRRAQYRIADSSNRSTQIVRNIVLAKLANSRTVILRAAREATCEETAASLGDGARRLVSTIEKVRLSDSVDAMRGLEGTGAKIYFDVFNRLLRTDQGFVMSGRTRRPPLDPVNALLSFLYSILSHDVRGACESVGLDAAVGFLHVDRPGRPGLALDLMEELRAFLADRLAITLINRGQLTLSDFVREECGAYRMRDAARKTLLTAYQKRKDDEIMHPFIREKISIGILPHVQAKLLARHLRGDLEQYPPFFLK